MTKTNKLKGQCAYLAGPMDRVADGGVIWRRDITPHLKSMGVGVLDPCNKPTAFAEETPDFRNHVQSLKDQNQFEEVRRLMRDITAIDLRMIDIAHFVIMYMSLDTHMCGSYNEAFLAVQQKKPLLIMCEQGVSQMPHWMFGVMPHQHMFSSWDDLLKYLHSIDEGNDTKHYKRGRFFYFNKVYN